MSLSTAFAPFSSLRNPVFARLYAAQTTGLLGDALTVVGHKLNTAVDVTLADTLNVGQAHELGEQVTKQLRLDIQSLSSTLVHTDPASPAGCQHDTQRLPSTPSLTVGALST